MRNFSQNKSLINFNNSSCCPFEPEYENLIFSKEPDEMMNMNLRVHIIPSVCRVSPVRKDSWDSRVCDGGDGKSERTLMRNSPSYFSFSAIYENVCSGKRSHECHLMKSRLHYGSGGRRAELVTVSQESGFINPGTSS